MIFSKKLNKGTDQSSRMRRLVYASVVGKPEGRFSGIEAHLYTYSYKYKLLVLLVVYHMTSRLGVK